jgi:hypothetical protein
VIDFLDQVFHAAERSPTNGLLRNAVEPDLHLIGPGGLGGREVHMESWPCGEPSPHSQMFVGSVIIHNNVHLQVLRHVLFNLPEKA